MKLVRCFQGREVPNHAILSHRRDDEAGEVPFQDMAESPFRRTGYDKIDDCWKRIVAYDVQYAWVDACCIDKQSSAELSEAINDMYSWYTNAGVCYVYLCDGHTMDDMLCRSWLSRGWTLQGLSAIKCMHLFNHA